MLRLLPGGHNALGLAPQNRHLGHIALMTFISKSLAADPVSKQQCTLDDTASGMRFAFRRARLWAIPRWHHPGLLSCQI